MKCDWIPEPTVWKRRHGSRRFADLHVQTQFDADTKTLHGNRCGAQTGLRHIS